MKKQLTAVLLMLVFLLTMAGCSAVRTVRALDDRMEAKLDAVEDKLEGNFRKTVRPVQTQPDFSPAQPDPVPSKPDVIGRVPSEENMMTKENAQNIALEYLGLSADQVTRLHAELEIDDGIPQFELEFYQGDWKYEFEIHAKDGRILSYDKDHKYD